MRKSADFFSRWKLYNLIWQTVLWFRCYFRWPFVPSVYLFFNQGRFAGGDLVFLVLERIMPGTRWCGKNTNPNVLYMHHWTMTNRVGNQVTSSSWSSSQRCLLKHPEDLENVMLYGMGNPPRVQQSQILSIMIQVRAADIGTPRAYSVNQSWISLEKN